MPVQIMDAALWWGRKALRPYVIVQANSLEIRIHAEGAPGFRGRLAGCLESFSIRKRKGGQKR